MDVAHEVIMPKQVLKVQKVWQYSATAFSPSGLVGAQNAEKLPNFKSRFYNLKVPKSKNWRKQTCFKIQFYIGIQLSWNVFGQFWFLTRPSIEVTIPIVHLYSSIRSTTPLTRKTILWAASNSKKKSPSFTHSDLWDLGTRKVNFGFKKGNFRDDLFFFMAPSDFSADTHPKWPHMRINRHESAWPLVVETF